MTVTVTVSVVLLLVPEQTREVEVFAAGSHGDFALRLSPVAPNSVSRPRRGDGDGLGGLVARPRRGDILVVRLRRGDVLIELIACRIGPGSRCSRVIRQSLEVVATPQVLEVQWDSTLIFRFFGQTFRAAIAPRGQLSKHMIKS